MKERLELYGKRADDIQRLITILLTVSTIYGIALAVNAYTEVKNSAQKVDKLLEKTEADVLKIFPLFEAIESSINNMMHHLLGVLPRLDLHEKTYASFSAEEKEKIFYYEKSVSALEVFNMKPFSEQVSAIFHGLGSFYALKYQAQKTPQDRERSVFYLEKAIELDPKNVKALNDRGYAALVMDQDFENAKKYLTKSLDIDDDQQRPRYNLAYIAHMQKEYLKSVEHITEALARHKWQVSPYAPRRMDLYYQRACSYVRLGIAAGTPPPKVDYFDFSVKDLKVIAEHQDTDWKGILTAFCGTKETVGDKDPGGDLYPLVDPVWIAPDHDKLNELRKQAQGIFDQFLGKKKLIN